MNEKKPEAPKQLSFEDLKERLKTWDAVSQPLGNGHTRVIITKRPSRGK